jgi:hypothetical protein
MVGGRGFTPFECRVSAARLWTNLLVESFITAARSISDSSIDKGRHWFAAVADRARKQVRVLTTVRPERLSNRPI